MNPTTLVLLPGLDGTEIFLGPLRRHLPEWIRPVVVRYPVAGDNRYEALLPLIHAEVASLDRFAILGWSFGGPLALMVAAQRPKQVSAIVLCATFVTPPHRGLVPFRFALRGPVIATVSLSAARALAGRGSAGVPIAPL